MSNANLTQIGGKHYKTQYEHWDFVLMVGMGYLEGCTTKYVARHRKKNGLEDLEKALHYLDKLIETPVDIHRRLHIEQIEQEVIKFAETNELQYAEEKYIFLLCTYVGLGDLKEARIVLTDIMANSRPGTPEDGGHHAM